MIQYGHYVGGKNVAGTSGKSGDVFQPLDGTVRGQVAYATTAEVRAAVENAKAAQPAWAAPIRSAAPACCSSSTS